MMLELALRSTAILGSAWILTRLLSRAAAATRHLVWHVALIAILLAPLVAPLAPKFSIPGASPIAANIARAASQLASSAPPASSLAMSPPSTRSLDTATSDQAIAGSASRPVNPTPLAAATDTLSTLGIAGTLGILLWFALGWVMTTWTVRRATRAPLQWQLDVNALCERLQIAKEVRVGVLADGGSPLAAGLFRAWILLPAAAAGWTTERRRAVLLHELAHIRRHDCRVQLLSQAACALYWFNPLVWIADARLRSERERACDDEVLRAGTVASSYATHLLDIARDLRPALRPSAAMAMARPSELEGRLLAVLADRPRQPRRLTRWTVMLGLSFVTTIALGATPGRHEVTPAQGAADTRTRMLVAQDVLDRSQRAAEARVREEATATLHASDDPEARRDAVSQLADNAPSESVEPLSAALRDPDPDVREKAALGLAFASGRDVIPALLTALADPDSQVREKAAIGLALRRDARVIEPLLAAMHDRDSQVREKVAIALGTSGDPRAREALEGALHDPDSQVREKAAAGLTLLSLPR